jgi:prevent-host-death family protein
MSPDVRVGVAAQAASVIDSIVESAGSRGGRARSYRGKLVNDWLIVGGRSMATVTAFEAKTRFGELLERVSRGEEVVITRHDKAVARLVPEGAPRHDDVRRSVQGLRDLQQRIRRRSKAKLTDGEVRAAIGHGRP